MQIYNDPQGDSGIEGYVISNGGLTVFFKGGTRYIYRAADIGASRLREMVQLAQAGEGLNTYINVHEIVKASGVRLA